MTLKAVRKVANGLKNPNADVPPAVIVQTPWEIKVFTDFGKNPDERDLIFRMALPDFIMKTKAKAVIYISMAWFTEHPVPPSGLDKLRDETGRLPYPDGVPPSKSPNRKEMLVVAEVTASNSAIFCAKVTRFENTPPLIEDLEEMPGESYVLRHAQRALRAVAGPG